MNIIVYVFFFNMMDRLMDIDIYSSFLIMMIYVLKFLYEREYDL